MADLLSDFVGTWELTGFGSVTINNVETEADPSEENAWAAELNSITQAWLNDEPEELPEVSDASGLTLVVGPDGAFSETGDSDVEFISIDGVLGDGSDAFPGVLEESEGRVHAFTEETRYGLCRVGDGDTDVADEFIVDGDELTRITSMVTDGMYLNRFVYLYQRG